MKQINLLNKIKYLINAGSIILTGFEPETVLSSVRTVIEEYNNSLPDGQTGKKYLALKTYRRTHSEIFDFEKLHVKFNRSK